MYRDPLAGPIGRALINTASKAYDQCVQICAKKQ